MLFIEDLVLSCTASKSYRLAGTVTSPVLSIFNVMISVIRPRRILSSDLSSGQSSHQTRLLVKSPSHPNPQRPEVSQFPIGQDELCSSGLGK